LFGLIEANFMLTAGTVDACWLWGWGRGVQTPTKIAEDVAELWKLLRSTPVSTIPVRISPMMWWEIVKIYRTWDNSRKDLTQQLKSSRGNNYLKMNDNPKSGVLDA